ncbi:UV DNA damage repair endonuclease UvsE [Paenibacillus sacheonensis]|uniref:UV DNA damage repair endonuclease UvsE n=1 Tax=Paenibacillus sacheonensis TaxID=742054 RepID=A0A7X4YVA1_9BACL|nr:UV DNA damage repair endonuclease UvsE [Paenibacillus sacheonensis]MBM7568000.1 UV DNA damage endonuclease [Paenibacillus sacheonensis]NBC73207.1 UV DNA damage repair endonuclease UvsE [Paenibacillus sacheonensis]
MIVRFGFVAMSVLLGKDTSPSRTMTYATFSKLDDREAGIRRLERIAEDNLRTTLRIMKHCVGHDVYVYRMTSKLIPLATHDALKDWNPYPALEGAFADIGRYAKEKGMRLSFHPDHFCVFSTPRPEVLAKSAEDLNYHVTMLEHMGLDPDTKCNIHVGGAYGDKPVALERFIRQFGALDGRLRSRVTLENDDKTFTVRETLEAAEAVGTPMVLDIHHHAVNDGGESDASLHDELWPRIVRTWNGPDGLPLAVVPKLHVSSPKSEKDPRGHADNVEVGPLLRFLRGVNGSVPRLDVMIEAKQKDAALLQLMDDMRQLQQEGERIRVIDGGSIEIL